MMSMLILVSRIMTTKDNDGTKLLIVIVKV